MDDRRCKRCGELKPITEFASAGVVNGVQYFRYKCKPCYLEFKNERRRRNRLKFDEYKKNLACADCGLADFRVIEFHHTDDNKEQNISEMMGFGFDSIMKEVEKCVPLCANCHRIKHYIDKNGE